MKKILLASLIVASLAACRDSQPPPYQAQYQQPAQPPQGYAPQATVAAPAPVIVNQAPAASGGDGMLTGGLLGAAAGYMLGKGSGASAPGPETRIIERRTVVKQYVQAPAVAVAAPVAPAVVKAPITPPAPTTPARTNYAAAFTKPAPAAPARTAYFPTSSRSSGGKK